MINFIFFTLIGIAFIWAVYDGIPEEHRPKLKPRKKHEEVKLPAIERIDDITE